MNKLFKKIYIIIFVITAVTLYDTNIYAAQTTNEDPVENWPVAPPIQSESAILIDADTGAILYELNSHEKCYPASTTKILTGLLTIENCNMNEVVTFSEKAANSINPYEDANLGTLQGEQYTVEQALYGLLLYSANEIAYGLGEHVSGDIESFVSLMNKKAKDVGALDTHFSNASGLYDANHYTTAYDMAMIARACYNNATFVNIDSTYSPYTIPPTNMKSTVRTFQHRHKMLKTREYYYEYCKGGKTGFTDQSQYTLVTFAEKNDMRLICVLFKSPSEDARFEDTRSLFEWGFSNFKKVSTSGSNLSSLLSSSTYYSSPVFSRYNIIFDLDATYLTLPNTLGSGLIDMRVDPNYETDNENKNLISQINFMLDKNTVGSSKLIISSSDNIHEGSNLPYKSLDSNGKKLSEKKRITIDLRLLIAIFLILSIAIYFIISKHQSKKRYIAYKNRRFK